ncbi:Glucose 1-dehydrogenase [Planctomycetes bacterium Pla163]|uniref:Glucose 1-dehydrogenase n=1 Tax=Rohdeia mirabilis TaxID=2528008 RepID=A0A518D2B8_9BACT|nr:Glucose 1-dehydrogenase [Planctomycetes bacterium Pla163]
MALHTGLAGRSVWITGASGGIGRACAVAFAREGARLVLSAGTRRAQLEHFVAHELASEVGRELGPDEVLVTELDVRRAASCDATAARALERFGRLDHVIVNAGVWPEADVPLARLDPARLEHTIAVNLTGAALTLRAFAAALAETGPRDAADPAAGGASAVAIGSTAGRFGEAGHADYALSKAGLTGLVLSLKNEWVALDPGARINLLEPGWTATEMAAGALADGAAVQRALCTTPLRRVASPHQIATVALTLASPALASHVTGQTVTVAGGMEGRLLFDPSSIDAERARDV